MYKSVILLQVFLMSCVLTSRIPSYVHVCKRRGPDIEKCVINTIMEIIPHLNGGIKDMNIPPLDPLRFQNFSVDTGSGSSIRFKAEIGEGTVEGLHNVQFQKMKYDLDHGRLSATFSFASLRVRANYKLTGKIMLFELDGAGPAEYNATDVLCEIELYGRYHKKEGKNYLIFDKIEVDTTAKEMSLRFENMFPGNPTLTDTLNQAINTNIKSLAEDLKPLVRETLAHLTLEYFNRVYSLFPINELYPED